MAVSRFCNRLPGHHKCFDYLGFTPEHIFRQPSNNGDINTILLKYVLTILEPAGNFCRKGEPRFYFNPDVRIRKVIIKKASIWETWVLPNPFPCLKTIGGVENIYNPKLEQITKHRR